MKYILLDHMLTAHILEDSLFGHFLRAYFRGLCLSAVTL